MSETVRVEIWSDLVCPWCYIGTARFERALADFERRAEVEVVHRSFELDPKRETTESVTTMLTTKYGPRAAGMDDQVAQLARSEGLAYRTDREVGSTLDAHRLLHLARERGVQHDVLRGMFQAHFGEAKSLFTPEALTEVAVEAGLDAEDVRRVLGDPGAYLDAVRADEREAARVGANGVPFFVLGERYGVSGAQPVEVFERALETAFGGEGK